MSFLSDVEGIFDPGGDPAAIRAAAAACQTLASSLRGVVSALDSIAVDLERSWKGVAGQEDQSASAAFQKAWSKFSAAIVEYAQGLERTADKLDEIANDIQSADAQAAHLKEMALASLAVGVGLTIFTFGISDATADAMAAADVAVAAGVMTELDAALASAVALLGDVADAFVPVAARFAMGAGLSLASEMVDKGLLQGENPVDPANYSANDVSNILLGGMLTAGMGLASVKVTSLAGFLDGSPILGNAAYGAAGGVLGSSISQFALEGKDLTWDTAGTVAVSGVISGVSGGALGAGGIGASKLSGVIGSKLSGSTDDGSTAGDDAAPGAGADPADLSLPAGNLDAPIPDLPAPAVGAHDGEAPGAPEPAPAGEGPAPAGEGPAPAVGPVAGHGDVGGAGDVGDGPAPAVGPVAGHGDVGGAGDVGDGPAPAVGPVAGHGDAGGTGDVGGTGAAGDGGVAAAAPSPAAPAGGDAAAPPAAPPAESAPAGPSPIVRALEGNKPTTTGIRGSDVLRASIGIPSGVGSYYFNFKPSAAVPAVPHAPAVPPAAPVPHVSPPPPVPPVPPAQVGGGTVTVRPGDSLYQIARQRLGNPNLYPVIQAANPQAVGPDGRIVPGQVLHIPRLPAPPAGSVAQVVQPGESVWEIAGGDPALAQRIAELNHLEDPSLIQPGQVLIVPPAT